MIMRNAVLLLTILFTALTAEGVAGVKEELVRLQSDVIALQNQIRVMEKTFNEQTEGLRSLVTQLNDQVGKSNLLIARISTALDDKSSGEKSANTAILQEIRGLASRIDDTATRISALAQQVSEMKVQTKTLNTRVYQSGDPAAIASSPDTVFGEAFNDLVQGHFDFAIEGFTAFIRNFPTHDKADDAQYNIGEAYYSTNKLPEAVAAFTRVLTDFPAGDKVASAYFKRGKAELLLQEKDNAIADFKTVVQKHPNAPEAALANDELERLGIDLSKKPAAPKPAPRRRNP